MRRERVDDWSVVGEQAGECGRELKLLLGQLFMSWLFFTFRTLFGGGGGVGEDGGLVGGGCRGGVGWEVSGGGIGAVLISECDHVGEANGGPLPVCTGEGGVNGGFRGVACFGGVILVCSTNRASYVGVGLGEDYLSLGGGMFVEGGEASGIGGWWGRVGSTMPKIVEGLLGLFLRLQEGHDGGDGFDSEIWWGFVCV